MTPDQADAWQQERDRVGRAKGLADRLDDASDRCADRAKTASNHLLTENLLARATTYQECAGLIREALK